VRQNLPYRLLLRSSRPEFILLTWSPLSREHIFCVNLRSTSAFNVIAEQAGSSQQILLSNGLDDSEVFERLLFARFTRLGLSILNKPA
jgi:hypothetical protein